MPTILGLIVALGGPPLIVLLSNRWFGDAPSMGVQLALQAVYCGLAVFVLWTVLSRERLPLASIGLHAPRWSTLGWAFLLWVVALQLLPLLTAPLRHAFGPAEATEGLRRLFRIPLWFRLILAVTGGVVEELLYRGYAIERLTRLTGKAWLAGAIAAVAFGLAHVPAWGLRYALAADLPFGIVATAFYIWRRDLVANMLAHCAGLIAAVLVVPP